MAIQYIVHLLSGPNGHSIGTHGPLGLKAAKSYAQKAADKHGKPCKLVPVRSNPRKRIKVGDRVTAGRGEDADVGYVREESPTGEFWVQWESGSFTWMPPAFLRVIERGARANPSAFKKKKKLDRAGVAEIRRGGVAALRDTSIRGRYPGFTAERAEDNPKALPKLKIGTWVRSLEDGDEGEIVDYDAFKRPIIDYARGGRMPSVRSTIRKTRRTKGNPSGFPLSGPADGLGDRTYRPRRTIYKVTDSYEYMDNGERVKMRAGQDISPASPGGPKAVRVGKKASAVVRVSQRGRAYIPSGSDIETSTRHTDGNFGKTTKKQMRSSEDYTGDVRTIVSSESGWGFEGRDGAGMEDFGFEVEQPRSIRIAAPSARHIIEAKDASEARQTQIAKRRKLQGYQPLLEARENPRPKVKRKAGAYALFVKSRMPYYQSRGLPAREAMKAIGAEWRSR